MLISVLVGAAGVAVLIVAIRRNRQGLLVPALGLAVVAVLAAPQVQSEVPTTLSWRLAHGPGMTVRFAESDEWQAVNAALASVNLPACGPERRSASFDSDSELAPDGFLALLKSAGYEYTTFGNLEALQAIYESVLGGNTVFRATGPGDAVFGAWTTNGFGDGQLYVCGA